MATIWHREYRSEFYDTLPHYDESELIEPPQEFLDASAALLEKWGLREFLGVSLLHKHFEVAEGEYLVRRFYKERDSIVGMSQPIPPNGSTIEYMWRYGSEDGAGFVAPVEFLSSEDSLLNLGYHAYFVKLASGFHEDFNSILQAFNLQRFFGLTLLPGHLFDLSGSRSLVENSDSKSFVVRPEVPSDDTTGTQTIWAFPSVIEPAGIICVSHVCNRHICSRHTCNIHCKVHCRQHCKRHGICKHHE